MYQLDDLLVSWETWAKWVIPMATTIVISIMTAFSNSNLANRWFRKEWLRNLISAVISTILITSVTFFFDNNISVIKQQIKNRQHSALAKKTRALVLAGEIREFLFRKERQYWEIEEGYRSGYYSSERDRHLAWLRMKSRETDHTSEMMIEYEEKFMSQTINLRDSIRALIHFAPAKDDIDNLVIESNYSHPTNPLGIDAVAKNLDWLASRIVLEK